MLMTTHAYWRYDIVDCVSMCFQEMLRGTKGRVNAICFHFQGQRFESNWNVPMRLSRKRLRLAQVYTRCIFYFCCNLLLLCELNFKINKYDVDVQSLRNPGCNSLSEANAKPRSGFHCNV